MTTTTPTTPTPAPPDPFTNPSAGLRSLSLAVAPNPCPPGDMLRDVDDGLADMLDRAATVQNTATRVALDWQRRSTGVQARRDDDAFVRSWLADHDGELPPVGIGPLADHPEDVHALYTSACRHEVAASWLRDEVQRQAASVAPDLDRLSDELRDEMASLLTKARDDHHRGAYDEAMNEIAPRWLQTKRLWEWATGNPWRIPSGRSYPGELELLEHEAATALGERRLLVPVEALSRPGAPPPKDAPVDDRPSVPMDGMSVNGEITDGRGGWFRRKGQS